MTKDEIYNMMSDTALFTKFSLIELRKIMEEYPYFHAARMLYLKNLAVLEDVCLKKELQRMSIFVPDRRRLFMLIESDRFAVPSQTNDTEAEENRQLPESPVEESPQKTKQTRKTDGAKRENINPADYVSWLEANADDLPDAPSGENAKLHHQDLIDSFIEGENKFNGVGLKPEASPTDENEEENSGSMPASVLPEKETLDDTYFTETLARVYTSQKKYDKALEIIRALSLKYPEKNAYFADQIRKLEEIINAKK